jgi:hypothetical protein
MTMKKRYLTATVMAAALLHSPVKAATAVDVFVTMSCFHYINAVGRCSGNKKYSWVFWTAKECLQRVDAINNSPEALNQRRDGYVTLKCFKTNSPLSWEYSVFEPVNPIDDEEDDTLRSVCAQHYRSRSSA